MELLKSSEASELARCEAVIESGLRTFIEVGTALLKIREERLYRSEFGSFEDYCRERWGMTRGRANQLVRAAEALTHLDTTVSTPTAEAQVRPLVGMGPDQQREAWSLASERTNGHPTARAVEAAVREVKGEPDRPPPGQMTLLADDDDGDVGRAAVEATRPDPPAATPSRGPLLGEHDPDEDTRERRAANFDNQVNQLRGIAARFDNLGKLDREVFRWSPTEKRRLAHSLECIRSNIDKGIRYLKGKGP